MLSKSLFIVMFFAAQCIDRSFEVYLEVMECGDEAECLEKIYDHKLHEGLVLVLVTQKPAPKKSDEEQVRTNILNFYESLRANIRVLQVNVKRGMNKLTATYLFPGISGPSELKYPFVAAMKNHKLLKRKVVGFLPDFLQFLLQKDNEDYVTHYNDFSSDMLYRIEHHTARLRPVREDVKNAILVNTSVHIITGLPMDQTLEWDYFPGQTSMTVATTSAPLGGMRRKRLAKKPVDDPNEPKKKRKYTKRRK